MAKDSDVSHVMLPKGKLAVFVVPATEQDKLRRRIYQQNRRNAAKASMIERIEVSVRERFEKLSEDASTPVDAAQIEIAVKDTVTKLTGSKKKRKHAASEDSVIEPSGRAIKVSEGRPKSYSTDSSRIIRWTPDQKHFIWTTFKEFHRLPDGDEGDNQAVILITKGGKNCGYADIVKLISRQRPAEYSEQLNRQNLNKLLQLLSKDRQKSFVGRNQASCSAVGEV
jgi:hypothetical protein